MPSVGCWLDCLMSRQQATIPSSSTPAGTVWRSSLEEHRKYWGPPSCIRARQEFRITSFEASREVYSSMAEGAIAIVVSPAVLKINRTEYRHPSISIPSLKGQAFVGTKPAKPQNL